MAFIPKTWVDDQIVYAEDMNRIEQGIANAVSFTSQTLTDAQKTQARGNIEAAPDGFGLGKGEAHEVVPDCNDVKLSGLYIMSSKTTNYPSLIPNGKYSLLRVSARTESEILQEVFCIGIDGQYDFSAVRSYGNTGVWSPWEYVNPPMQLGVEYRTTERYLGKPVYTMAFQFGALPNSSDKVVEMPGTDNTCEIFEIHGLMSSNMTLPGFSGIDSASEIHLTGLSNTAYIVTKADRSSATAVIVAKYFKTTD